MLNCGRATPQAFYPNRCFYPSRCMAPALPHKMPQMSPCAQQNRMLREAGGNCLSLPGAYLPERCTARMIRPCLTSDRSCPACAGCICWSACCWRWSRSRLFLPVPCPCGWTMVRHSAPRPPLSPCPDRVNGLARRWPCRTTRPHRRCPTCKGPCRSQSNPSPSFRRPMPFWRGPRRATGSIPPHGRAVHQPFPDASRRPAPADRS